MPVLALNHCRSESTSETSEIGVSQIVEARKTRSSYSCSGCVFRTLYCFSASSRAASFGGNAAFIIAQTIENQHDRCHEKEIRSARCANAASKYPTEAKAFFAKERRERKGKKTVSRCFLWNSFQASLNWSKTHSGSPIAAFAVRWLGRAVGAQGQFAVGVQFEHVEQPRGLFVAEHHFLAV